MSLQIQLNRLNIGTHCLLENWQLECPSGTVTTLMGPSGSGKSTLLAAVCGTLAPAVQFEGQVLLNGVRIDSLPTQARRVGILFQDDLLFAHMSVLENLLFAMPRAKGNSARQHRAQATDKATQALADAELSGFEQANPATLSGGQRARVSLLRALLAEPQALLLDEPFSRLDQSLRARFKDFVFARCRASQIPTLLVTHDPSDIADPDRVRVLEQAPNR
jgi:putative thiamine transport system ATP-binding protein